MKVKLTIVQGPLQGRAFGFEKHDTFLVGRAKYAHFRLKAKDPCVSRAHFLVEVNPPLCRLTDLASTNGSFVNGERVSQVDLRDGDVIDVGDTAIKVSIQETKSVRSTRRAVRRHSDEIRQQHSEPAAADGIPAEGLAPTITYPASLPSGTPSQLSATGTPERAGGYQLLRELGHGGMGVVHLAMRPGTRNPIALKTVKPNGPTSRRVLDQFAREASILQELDHPHIVQFYEFGQSDGLLYFAMEYVAGIDASELLRTKGALPVRRAAKIACQLLEALEYAHQQGFVHRDVKPANLLMNRVRGEDFVKLADFGLARVYQASTLSGLTVHGDIGGSLAFTPPEQLLNYRDVKPSADLYSAAATLYTILTDKYVYDFPKAMNQRLLKILQETPVPVTDRRTDLPRRFAEIIHRGLARTPGDRFASAAEMREALTPFAGSC